MQNYENVIGNQQDWANAITNVEMRETPCLDWLPIADKPTVLVRHYQAEKYRAPIDNRHADGQPVTGFKSAGDSRAELIARCQYATKAAAVSKLHEDMTNVAGLTSELAHEIDKQNKELKTDMEAGFLDAKEAVVGDRANGCGTRSIGSWLSTSQHTVDDFDANFRPPASSVDTSTATSSFKEDTVLNILESMGTETKSKELITAFVGTKIKRAFNNMPLFTPTSTLVGGSPTGATGIVYEKELAGRAIDRVIERYNSDFGPVDLVMSFFQKALTGNAIERGYTCYFLHQSKWKMAWKEGGMPKWVQKAYQGGSYEAFCETIYMLICLNPRGEGMYSPTT